MWYSLDVYKLGKLLLPQDLRQNRLMALLDCYLRPLNDLHYLWTQIRNKNIYILEHNWQICYMRGALNDEFDAQQRRIYITDGVLFETTYVYTEAEQQELFVYTEEEEGILWIYTEEETADTGVDFIVYVPAEIMATQFHEVHAQIQLYKLGGKRYMIIEI